MTPHRDDVAKVAAKLTPACRRALAGAFQASWGDWYIPSGIRWDVRRRLVEAKMLSRRTGHALLPLGLAVRNHLLNEARP